MNKRFLIPAALALALGGGFTTLQTGSALAQAASTPAPGAQAPAQAPRAARPHRDFAARLEGRIAYLKAALKITPAQEAQFDKVAQAMRANAGERQKSFEGLRGQRDQSASAIDRLETSVKLSQERTRGQERYLAAFKPLYESLSPAQKQTADSLLAPHHFGHHRHRA